MPERRAEPGQAAADDQDVGEVVRQVLRVEPDQVAPRQLERCEHETPPGQFDGFPGPFAGAGAGAVVLGLRVRERQRVLV